MGQLVCNRELAATYPYYFQPPAGTRWRVYAIVSETSANTTHVIMVYDGSIWVTLLRETTGTHHVLIPKKGGLILDNIHYINVIQSANRTAAAIYYEQIPPGDE